MLPHRPKGRRMPHPTAQQGHRPGDGSFRRFPAMVWPSATGAQPRGPRSAGVQREVQLRGRRAHRCHDTYTCDSIAGRWPIPLRWSRCYKCRRRINESCGLADLAAGPDRRKHRFRRPKLQPLVGRRAAAPPRKALAAHRGTARRGHIGRGLRGEIHRHDSALSCRVPAVGGSVRLHRADVAPAVGRGDRQGCVTRRLRAIYAIPQPQSVQRRLRSDALLLRRSQVRVPQPRGHRESRRGGRRAWRRLEHRVAHLDSRRAQHGGANHALSHQLFDADFFWR
mmetsp:Transcript_73845/g.213706  ORF Transcript_73845/g.213706 Transcript_73845/m.213706 type:complete len:281 (+) Transcript_73845:541-1383(+)